MLSDPSQKYLPYPDVPPFTRTWPAKRVTKAPIWLSTCLRDGNQALVNPMSNAVKLDFFRTLVACGFKEIEVAYPAASDAEFNFCRTLVETGEIPDDVAIQVITPCRAELIERSVAAVTGAKHAIIHLYNAVSPLFRDVVFRNSPDETADLVVRSVKLVKKLTAAARASTGTKFTLNYCMETFSQTEPEFAVRLANEVLEAWGDATPESKVIFNLAATVECAPPNHYADMVEYFCQNVNQRDSVLVSLHAHNDRGTGVAATELGLLAGGDRVEGCLLGNGERTGNVDLVTLALNMYSQGVSPRLDFSNLSEVVKVVESCTGLSVPDRYPYAGQLVFSAFAGTHQDAIRKGLEKQEKRHARAAETGEKKYWAVPYIPVDPQDLGYSYDNLIRISSQSGKAGAAHLLSQSSLALELPRSMQTAFYGVVQAACDASGKELTMESLLSLFRSTYHLGRGVEFNGRLRLDSFECFPSNARYTRCRVGADLLVDGHVRRIDGEADTPIAALLDALDRHVNLRFGVREQHVQELRSHRFAAFVELAEHSPQATLAKSRGWWGVGMSADVTAAKLRAVISAVNGSVGSKALPPPKLVFRARFEAAVDARLDTPDMHAGAPPEPLPQTHVSTPVVSQF
ncbi:aldolase [Exidia glandulosa HHB12029]|uniref:2-isopropylmalate synthase n=1 Tax=Exidia glandulosa HHB12029 TaxID=1314781 RepID=A0A165HY32_EXIGL|nr:aldolase [Exidia glandulosa HHB12029]